MGNRCGPIKDEHGDGNKSITRLKGGINLAAVSTTKVDFQTPNISLQIQTYEKGPFGQFVSSASQGHVI